MTRLQERPVKERARLKFALLAALFAAPIVAAWLVYSVRPDWQPGGRVNYGTLIDPARPLPALKLAGADGDPASMDLLKKKWSLVQIGAASCDASCRGRLLLTRQVRAALNQDRERVQRVYLAPDVAAAAAARAALAPDHPDLLVLADVGVPGTRATDFFQPADAAAYLLDPHGNWVLWYRAPVDPRGLHKDLMRLLKFSVIG